MLRLFRPFSPSTIPRVSWTRRPLCVESRLNCLSLVSASPQLPASGALLSKRTLSWSLDRSKRPSTNPRCRGAQECQHGGMMRVFTWCPPSTHCAAGLLHIKAAISTTSSAPGSRAITRYWSDARQCHLYGHHHYHLLLHITECCGIELCTLRSPNSTHSPHQHCPHNQHASTTTILLWLLSATTTAFPSSGPTPAAVSWTVITQPTQPHKSCQCALQRNCCKGLGIQWSHQCPKQRRYTEWEEL